MNLITDTANGLLFIGDPHVCSYSPGRRKDNYLASVLGKLEFCANLANQKGFLAVVTGDLLHRHDDNDLRMINRLLQVLAKFEKVPIVLAGNHDSADFVVGEDDVLFTLALAGKVRLIQTPGLAAELTVEGVPCAVYGYQHGTPLPDSVPKVEAHGGLTIGLTHHDMAFDSAYPGALPLLEIKGMDMVVNGHMHAVKPSKKVGGTWWHNPGNIEPLSIDLANHVPRAWLWKPSQGAATLSPVDLPYEKDVFDRKGLVVEAAEPGAAVESFKQSEFVEELFAQVPLQAYKTADGSVIREELREVAKLTGVSSAAESLIEGLLSCSQD
jgi:predicted phosphodiesterase